MFIICNHYQLVVLAPTCTSLIKDVFYNIRTDNSPIPWRPQSPDLNSLDFWIWGHLVEFVHRANPRDIDQFM